MGRQAGVTPRQKFASASQEDKFRRAALYEKGQYRLWINKRKVGGPVRLKGVTYSTNPESVGATEGERLWVCELMWCDGEQVIGEYDLGTEITEMEAIAWASV